MTARRWIGVVLLAAVACTTSPAVHGVAPAAAIDARDVRDCLQANAPSGKWDEISTLSDFGATVYGIDFGSNSVQLYIEKGASEVQREITSIETAERQSHASPVTLIGRGNVLVSWANPPAAAQKRLVTRCVGFA